MHQSERLSMHFGLAEMCVTSTGLPNTPSPQHVSALTDLCLAVLEPWRAMVGPLRVNSGYRSPPVNRAVHGSPTSDHMAGRAADVVPVTAGVEAGWRALVDAVARGLPVDQCILYPRAPGHGWIHVSHRARTVGLVNRGQLLVESGGRYLPWAGWTGPLVLG